MAWTVAALAVLKVIAEAVKMPIINKAIDNLVAGTPTQIDDYLWRLVEEITGADAEIAADVVTSPGGAERVAAAAARAQTWYEAMAPEARAAAKEAVA